MQPDDSWPNPHPTDGYQYHQGPSWRPQPATPQREYQPSLLPLMPGNGQYPHSGPSNGHVDGHYMTPGVGPIPPSSASYQAQPMYHGSYPAHPQYPLTPQYSPHPPVHTPPSHQAYHQPIHTVEAVPQPMPKVAYEAPVFQTFQERRRAKEMALRAQATGGSSDSSAPEMIYTTRIMPSNPSSPAPLSISRPSDATVAMMGRPSIMSNLPPTPPVRSRSPGDPLQKGSNGRDVSSSVHNAQPRPLPPPRALPPTSNESSRSATPSSSGPSSPFTSNQRALPPALIHSAAQASLERSDTISSVKSLDRMGFSSSPAKRTLPKPPVGVNSSRSLDRGIPSGAGASPGVSIKPSSKRRQPSIVAEELGEDDLAKGVAAISMADRSTTLPSTPIIRTPSPSSSSRPPSITFPGDVPPAPNARTPAKFSPLPAIVVPDSDTSSLLSTEDESEIMGNNTTPRAKRTSDPGSPGIQFAGLPTISVSTSDSADEPHSGGEISFTVPNISVGPSPAVPTSTPSIQVAPFTPTAANSARRRVHNDGAAILCTGCDQPIIGRIVNAMNQRWHPQCFMCAECGELLEHVSSYEWEGKAYCHLDYHDKFAHRCHHCQTPIVDSRFVTLNDPVLGQRYYHELHFFCSECGDPFLDPSKSSAPGTEKLRSGSGADEEGEDEGETNAFVIHRGHPYCERCHLRLHKPKCKACTQPIPDVAINAMGAKWHKECFVCSNCRQEFANNLFFPKGGNAFCTSCYGDIVAIESHS